MSKTEKLFYDVGIGVVYIIINAAIGLLLAFPIKWTWNHTMPYLFQFPIISWGTAWCLFFLSNCLIKSRLISTNPEK